MPNEEIMEAIHEGDRHAGVLFEDVKNKFIIIMVAYDTLNNKIDAVDRKLENFREEATMKFDILFNGQEQLFIGQKQFFEGQKQLFEDKQGFFDELLLMRQDFSTKFDHFSARFNDVSARFDKLEKLIA